MEKKTLEQIQDAIVAVRDDRALAARVQELAQKSTAGTLSAEERAEYTEIVRLNELLSLLRVQAQDYWAPRLAS